MSLNASIFFWLLQSFCSPQSVFTAVAPGNSSNFLLSLAVSVTFAVALARSNDKRELKASTTFESILAICNNSDGDVGAAFTISFAVDRSTFNVSHSSLSDAQFTLKTSLMFPIIIY